MLRPSPHPLPLTPHPFACAGVSYGDAGRSHLRGDHLFLDRAARCRMATPAQRSNNSPQRFRRDKQYRGLFDARLMQKRLELGLPLVSTAGIGDVPKELQQAYQDASVHAAREVGELILADRNIPQAWPYFRAIGDTGPIIQALDTFDVPDARHTGVSGGSGLNDSNRLSGRAASTERLRVDSEALRPVPRHYDVRRLSPAGWTDTNRCACSSGRSMARSSTTSGARSRTSKERGRRAIRLPRSSTDATGSSRTTRSIPTAHTSRRYWIQRGAG